jgi:uncharacterized alkaline shock family protein YloU
MADAPGQPRYAERGVTQVSTEVMEKVAALAVREANGVWGFDHAAVRNDGRRAIEVTLIGRTAAATVRLTVEHGHAVHAVIDEVRAKVIDALESQFGLEVTAVDVVVEDVHVADAHHPNTSVTPESLGPTFRVISRHSGTVLSVEGGSTSDGALIVQATDTGAPTQRWRLVNAGGYTVLVNAGSGKALDVPGGSTAPGVQLIQWAPNHGDNQQWTLGTSGGYLTLISRRNGLFVDVNALATHDGAAVIQWQFNGGPNQQVAARRGRGRSLGLSAREGW